MSPDGNTAGALAVVISVGGGLVVGLLAFFGSEQIRGHGIPEAMERILINGSRAQQRLALLKPASSPVSSGTGGLFGAEGRSSSPGGLGSVVGQLFRLIAAERRALLVAAAAARLGGGARQRHERRHPRSRPHAVCGGGGVFDHVLPGTTVGVWALFGLAGALGGVTRSPCTAIVFAFELTHAVGTTSWHCWWRRRPAIS